MTSRDDTSAEDRLISRFFVPLASHPGALALSDDAAFLKPPPGCDLVLKTDAIVGGVHFFPDDAAHTVASKALRVNLSDLAAKGAVPHGYLMTLLLPGWPDRAWLEQFAEGLACDQAEFGLRLLGGDISSTPGPLAISIAAFGLIEHGALIRRAGAKPGDSVFVSGTIGDSAGGLSVLKGEAGAAGHQELIARYRIPSPRLELGRSLRAVASAALDESIAYAKARESFGAPIASRQAIQWMLADMATELDAARLLVYRAARLKDSGTRFSREASMAKLFASEAAVRIANEAVQIHGGYGFIKDYPVEKFYRDVKLCTIGEGTSEIQRLVIARQLLKS